MFLKRVAGVLMLGYPAAIYFAVVHLGARSACIVVAACCVAAAWRRAQGAGHEARSLAWLPCSLAAIAFSGALLNDRRLVLALPALVNLTLLASFAASCASVSIVERIALAMESNLTAEQRAYCRRVTQIWCVFFAVNGLLCGVFALAAPIGWWATYTGCVAYGLAGALFGAEYVVRRYRFRKFGAGLFDRVLRRLIDSMQPRSTNP